jgi:dihydroxy-acid dehydratase
LAFVQDGDFIELDVEVRRLHLDVSEEELARRRSLWKPTPLALNGGYQQMYVEHVMQADKGADLDFLVGCRGTEVPRESH